MRVTIATVLVGGIGLLLIWAGITDRHPAEVVRSVLTGNQVPPAGSWAVSGGKGLGRVEGGKGLTRERNRRDSGGTNDSGGILV